MSGLILAKEKPKACRVESGPPAHKRTLPCREYKNLRLYPGRSMMVSRVPMYRYCKGKRLQTVKLLWEPLILVGFARDTPSGPSFGLSPMLAQQRPVHQE